MQGSLHCVCCLPNCVAFYGCTIKIALHKQSSQITSKAERLCSGSGLTFFALSPALLFLRGPVHDPFRKFLCSRLAVPLLEGLVGDFPLHEKLREFAPLRLALERH